MSKAEVDFILEAEGEIMPIETKTTLQKTQISPSLHSFINTYHPRKSIVVTSSFWDKRQLNETHVTYLPIWALEKESFL